MKVGLLQISFLRNPSRKTSTNNINNRVGDVCCFFFKFLVKRSFPQGQTDRRINTEHMGREMILNQSCFYLQRHDCMHYICSDHLLWGTLFFFFKSNQHLRRKQLHCIDNKTMSQFSSTKGSAGISGNNYSMMVRVSPPNTNNWTSLKC